MNDIKIPDAYKLPPMTTEFLQHLSLAVASAVNGSVQPHLRGFVILIAPVTPGDSAMAVSTLSADSTIQLLRTVLHEHDKGMDKPAGFAIN